MSHAKKGKCRYALCSHISVSGFVLFHRAKPVTEMKRSGIEVGFVFADNAKEAENANMTEMRRENHCIRRIRH